MSSKFTTRRVADDIDKANVKFTDAHDLAEFLCRFRKGSDLLKEVMIRNNKKKIEYLQKYPLSAINFIIQCWKESPNKIFKDEEFFESLPLQLQNKNN